MRKTSDEAKAAKGTLHQTRAKQNGALKDSFIFTEGIPAPYCELNEDQSRLYFMICHKIKQSMPLIEVDTFSLVSLAVWVDIADKAKASLDKFGSIQVYEKTGARAMSPELQVYERATKAIKDIGNQFGLTPKDRVALIGSFTPPQQKVDPLDGL
jgi:phage terminase small subunit